MGFGPSAHALQPLDQFVASAHSQNVSESASRANLQVAQAQADVALGRQLPAIAARGAYTFNQYAQALPAGSFGVIPPTPPATEPTKLPPVDLTITPQNQLDGTATIQVPLVDLASFQRIAAARTNAEAANHQLDNVKLLVDSQVVQNYYQLVANMAVVTSAKRALEVAKSSQKQTRDRVSAGASPSIDGDRADAEVERQVQLLASSQLQVSLAAQQLYTSSGLLPDLANGEPPLTDDLHPEPPLDQFKPVEGGTPAQQAAASSTEASRQQSRAARLQLVPSLGGNGTEHVSNYKGFSNQNISFQAVVALTWALDYSTFANMRLTDGQLALAEANQVGVDLQTRDAIHNAWAAIDAAIARAKSARVQVQVTRHAQEMAQDRYNAGAATQLEVTTAERDAFTADVARIQADADLINARLQLRLATGRDPFAAPGATP
ncbi:MAG: TolC family protein [Deltaproteobacteria bacterium]|nr:TolC family protein [Deltaproteobacteria bacterium]